MAVRPRRAPWVGCVVLASAAASAAVPRTTARLAADTLTALPGAGMTKPLRIQPTVRWGQATPPAAWTTFRTAAGGSWQAAWDAATGVPTRIWGSGIAAPGAMAHADVAEQIARQVLASNLALLAPGATVADFELVSNVSDGHLRSIGFVQRAGGRRVVGGQVSFQFQHDRLFVIGSEALPNVTVSVPRARLQTAMLRDRVAADLRTTLALPNAPVSAPGDEVVLPLVGDAAVLGYRLVAPLTIDGGAEGRYVAYADPTTGGVVAVKQLNEYATGTVLYHGVDRYPGRGRLDRPAPLAHVTVDGTAQTTTGDGQVSWSPDAQVQVQTSIEGDLVKVVNKALACSNDDTMTCTKDSDCGSGNHCISPTASATLALDPGGQLVWDASGLVPDDAQLNAYLAINIAKAYIRAHVDPTMANLDLPLTANVNIAQDCNAYFDGASVNFFHATANCENTGRVLDVMFHEFGHDVHESEIIPGVGDFDGAMSEGVADFLAASITGDSGMGRGFFYTDMPLRELDPPDSEWRWPEDIGEIHHTGMIIGGALWDLRKTLIAQYGDVQGVALANQFYLAALRSSVNIPTSLIAILAYDDNDGDLSNGTPHECAIREAYGRHGIRTASGSVVAPGTLEQAALSIGVIVQVDGLSDRCNIDHVLSADLDWRPPYTGVPAAGTTAGMAAGPNRFFAELPLAPQEAISYRARIHFDDGSTFTLADNFADPFYQLYQGRTIKLYCTDFETNDPFAEGWTTGTNDGSPSAWVWGTPTAGATDPHAAYSGSKAMIQALDGDYAAKQYSWVKSPPISIGPYSDVRVQYRRWLAVEDGHFDQARVTANDARAWNNSTENAGDNSARHHLDREWRFHDVALSGYFSGHTVTVGWDLKSDDGLNLGGWALDDVCIVANPFSICGDGVRSPTEQCDTGAMNADIPNVCRTDCHLPACGDHIVDTGEECDDGSAGSPGCSAKCTLLDIGTGGGCCSSSGGGAGSLALGAMVGVLALRRRRR